MNVNFFSSNAQSNFFKPSVETAGSIASARPSVFRPSTSVETAGSIASTGSSCGSSCGSSSGGFSAVA